MDLNCNLHSIITKNEKRRTRFKDYITKRKSKYPVLEFISAKNTWLCAPVKTTYQHGNNYIECRLSLTVVQLS
jgi:hypothetical protein